MKLTGMFVVLLLGSCSVDYDKEEENHSGDSMVAAESTSVYGPDSAELNLCKEKAQQAGDDGFRDFDDLAKSQSLLNHKSGAGLTGGVVGNGGDAVICKDNNGKLSYSVLDFFEAKLTMGLSPSLGDANVSEMDKALRAIARMESLDPERAKRYRSHAISFMSETKFIDGDLVDIPDSYHFVLPKNCEIKQLAIQRDPDVPAGKRYNINRKLWNSLSRDHRAGLILHEIIYREAVELGHKDSVKVRAFNSMIASGEILKMQSDDYMRMLVKLKLDPIKVIKGIAFYLGTIEFFDNPRVLKKGKLFRNFSPKKGLVFVRGSDLSFYDTGEFREGYLAEEYRDYEKCIKVRAGSNVIFNTDGQLTMVNGRGVD